MDAREKVTLPVIRFVDPGEVEDVQLMGEAWWARAVFDNPDDVRDLWDDVETAQGKGRTDTASLKQITTYNAETLKDAASAKAYFEESFYDRGVISLLKDRPGWIPQVQVDAGVASYLQTVRLLGVSDEEKRNGKTSAGLLFSEYQELSNPRLTGMIPEDTFEANLADLAKVNEKVNDDPNLDSESQVDLLTHPDLKGNGIVEGYNAYVDMVGFNDAVSFDAFLNMQIHGIGRYRLPVPDAAVLKRMDMDTTDTTP